MSANRDPTIIAVGPFREDGRSVENEVETDGGNAVPLSAHTKPPDGEQSHPACERYAGWLGNDVGYDLDIRPIYGRLIS